MSFGSRAFGARTFGRLDLVDAAPARAFGGSVYGATAWGFGSTQEGEITGDAIAVSSSVVGTVGGYSIILGNLGVGGGTVEGQITLTGAASADIGIGGGSVAGVVTAIGTTSGDIGISGSAVAYIRLDGDVSGDAIGISGSVFGFAGNVASYDRVSARLITSPTRARIVTEPVRGRIENDIVKGRI